MTIVQQYNLNEFKNIMNAGFDSKLDDTIIKQIQELADKVGAPEYIRTPQFPKNQNYKSKRVRNKNQEISEEDWEAIRQFQATEIKKKEGIDASIDKIRIYLNKITKNKYDLQRDAIVIEIDALIQMEEQIIESELEKVSESIFTIASGNSFYSVLYAELYEFLMKKYDFIYKTFEQHFVTFGSLFHDIRFCTTDNYDEFCEINKINEQRRALSLFYVNLMKRGVVTKDHIIDIILDVQRNILKHIDKDKSNPIVEELTEVLFILITNTHVEMKKHKYWNGVIERIDRVACMKVKSLPSISNKTIFKHMDIKDAIAKHIKNN